MQPTYICALRNSVLFCLSYICWGVNAKMLVGWLYLASHRQHGHLDKAPPFTVPCDGREAQFLHLSHRELNPGPSRGSTLQYRCAMPAPMQKCLDLERVKSMYIYTCMYV